MLFSAAIANSAPLWLHIVEQLGDCSYFFFLRFLRSRRFLEPIFLLRLDLGIHYLSLASEYSGKTFAFGIL